MHLFQSPHKPPFLTLFKVFSKAALGFRSQTQKAQAFLTAAMDFLLGSLREGKKKKKGTLPTQVFHCHPTQTGKLGKLAAHVYLNIVKAFPTGNLCVAYLISIIL